MVFNVTFNNISVISWQKGQIIMPSLIILNIQGTDHTKHIWCMGKNHTTFNIGKWMEFYTWYKQKVLGQLSVVYK